MGGFKCMEFGFTAAMKVTGFKALIDRWIKTFLTPKGSDPLYPDEGTSVGALIGANISKVTTDLRDIVTMSITKANEQIQRQDIEGFYDDVMRLKSATLDRLVTSADGIEVWITIENVAGERLTVPTMVIGSARGQNG